MGPPPHCPDWTILKRLLDSLKKECFQRESIQERTAKKHIFGRMCRHNDTFRLTTEYSAIV